MVTEVINFPRWRDHEARTFGQVIGDDYDLPSSLGTA